MSRLVTIEDGPAVQLPADWVAEMGIGDTAEVEKTRQGILIRPWNTNARSWDAFFATKLKPHRADSGTQDDTVDLTGDDVLF